MQTYYAFRNDYGFAMEYTYQDCAYIFRTKHAQLVTKRGIPAPGSKHVCDQVAYTVLTS